MVLPRQPRAYASVVPGIDVGRDTSLLGAYSDSGTFVSGGAEEDLAGSNLACLSDFYAIAPIMIIKPDI